MEWQIGDKITGVRITGSYTIVNKGKDKDGRWYHVTPNWDKSATLIKGEEFENTTNYDLISGPTRDSGVRTRF